MNVFFNASISGKREFKDNYRQIVESIEQLGHMVHSPHAIGRNIRDIAGETAEEAGAYYRRLRNNISRANICVFEVSYPSTGIGHEVTIALNLNKPVVALHVKDRPPYILEAIPSDDLQVLEYSLNTLKRILTDAVHIASEQMDTRFNFFISRRLSSYLDWISRKRRIPRAVYLRQLIKKEMSKQREFFRER
ncbi:hypothetical protein IH980_00535 [Patescibacteria group bacterium]|nr:hypothetical protein [Patescibacteria group bacterium]